MNKYDVTWLKTWEDKKVIKVRKIIDNMTP